MAVDCTSKGMYESLSWCPGQTSQPGIRRKVFFIPKSWIDSQVSDVRFSSFRKAGLKNGRCFLTLTERRAWQH